MNEVVTRQRGQSRDWRSVYKLEGRIRRQIPLFCDPEGNIEPIEVKLFNESPGKATSEISSARTAN